MRDRYRYSRRLLAVVLEPCFFYFGTRFVNRIGCRDPTPPWRPTAVRTNAHFPSNRLRRVLQYHDTRVATTRALRGATPDTTTPAFPLREPFGARHPPSLENLQNSNSDHVPQYHHDMPSCTTTTATSNARHPPPPAAQPTSNPEPLAPAAGMRPTNRIHNEEQTVAVVHRRAAHAIHNQNATSITTSAQHHPHQHHHIPHTSSTNTTHMLCAA